VDIARGFASKLSSAAAPGAAAGAKIADDGSVVNSLVIRGRDQVSLKVTIAEVQRQVLKQLGVATNTVAGEKQVAGVWGSFTQDNPLSLSGQLSKTAVQFLGPNNTSVTLNAFERYGVSRVLAEPTVTAVSGENAKFMGRRRSAGSGKFELYGHWHDHPGALHALHCLQADRG
jgi:pilus assembly protein CpaC